MRIKSKLFVLSFTIALFTQAQLVRVTDQTSGRPISDVFVYHEDKEHFVYTDQKGLANIEAFPKGLIFFQHPSFHQASIAYLGSDIKVSLKEKIMAFNEVVISANKWEQKEESVSQQIMTVNRKTIEFQNPQTSN